MDGRSQCRRCPDQPAGHIGDDLEVDAVALVFPGVVRLLVVDAIDGDQGAVQDRVGDTGRAVASD